MGGVMTAVVESQIDLFWYFYPPSFTNPIEGGSWNDTNNIWGIVQSLRVICSVSTITM